MSVLTPLDSQASSLGIFTASGQHPLRLLEPTLREQKCLGITSPGAGLTYWLMGTQYKYSSFPSWNGDSLQSSLWNWVKVPFVLLCCLSFLVPSGFSWEHLLLSAFTPILMSGFASEDVIQDSGYVWIVELCIVFITAYPYSLISLSLTCASCVTKTKV